eukprot:4997139-Amphidinium_carterae.1
MSGCCKLPLLHKTQCSTKATVHWNGTKDSLKLLKAETRRCRFAKPTQSRGAKYNISIALLKQASPPQSFFPMHERSETFLGETATSLEPKTTLKSLRLIQLNNIHHLPSPLEVFHDQLACNRLQEQHINAQSSLTVGGSAGGSKRR